MASGRRWTDCARRRRHSERGYHELYYARFGFSPALAARIEARALERFRRSSLSLVP